MGFNYLLELGETPAYLYQFIKGYDKRREMNSQVRRYIGQVMWEGAGLSCSLPESLHMFITWKLSEPCLFGFLWRLHYIGMAD